MNVNKIQAGNGAGASEGKRSGSKPVASGTRNAQEGWEGRGEEKETVTESYVSSARGLYIKEKRRSERKERKKP